MESVPNDVEQRPSDRRQSEPAAGDHGQAPPVIVHEDLCRSLLERNWVRMKFLDRWAPAVWARFTAPATPGSTVWSRSRSFLPTSPSEPNFGNASNVRRGPFL